MKKEIPIFLATLTPDCSKRGCVESPFMIPDKSQPAKTYMDNGKEWQEDDDKRKIVSSVSYSSVPHESGLCYFHLKCLEGYFSASYPLKGSAQPMGEGGLSKCPIAIKSLNRRLVKPGRRPGLQHVAV